eukprot:c25415_g1_i1 orf=317-2809(+)
MPSRQRRLDSSYASTIRADVSPSNVDSKHSSHKNLILALSFTGATILIIVLTLAVIWYRKSLKTINRRTSPDDGTVAKLRKFSYRELKRATDSFNRNRKLGKGGFGIVYRGVLRDGKEVAVKKLELSSLQGEREFQNEVSINGELNTPYVVNLIGYCTHGKTVRLLVYECMQNGSLQEALFDKTYRVQLDWDKRFKIILDTGKALAFLHLDCNPPIIHGDVKPSNILLDSNFHARIADFGLARLKTEECSMGSGRPSTSTDKLRPGTPDKYPRETAEKSRFGTPDRFEFATPDREAPQTTGRVCTESVDKGVFQGQSEEISMVERNAMDGIPFENRYMMKGVSPSMDENLARSAIKSHHHLATNARSESNDEENLFQPSPSADENIIEGGNNTATEILHTDVDCHWQGARELGMAETSNCNRTDLSDGNVTDEIATCDQEKQQQKESTKEKLSDKDWWWKQESENISVKDYVMEWIGSELQASNRNGSFRQENLQEIVPEDKNQLRGKGMEAPNSQDRMSEIRVAVNGEPKTEKKKYKVKHKKGREWWKDEYFAELSNKNRDTNKGNGSRKKIKLSPDNFRRPFSGELNSYMGDLKKIDERPTQMGKGRRLVDWRCHHSGDLSFSSDWWSSKRREPPVGKEMRSGELLIRQIGDRHWSGDLTRSGELVSRDVSSTTSMRGTVCYVAPELGGGILSEKVDIYSLGVLILVIISGRRPIQVTASPAKEFEKANLISWARNLSKSGNILDLVDERLQGNYDRDQASLCINLALLCLQRVPATRPSITDVVKILTGEIAPPSFSVEFSPSPPSRISVRSPMQPFSELIIGDSPH